MTRSDGGTPGAAPWTALPNGRVAEVIVSRDSAKDSRGSGYLIAPGLVLTCAHTVENASGIRVRFNAGRQPHEREFDAATAWHHARIDIAVLTIGSQEPVPSESFARIGDQTVRLPCEAKGLPLFKLVHAAAGGRFRDVDHVHATCAPHANSRARTLNLRVEDPPDPDADPRHPDEQHGEYKPWAGMSGAVVFSAGRIIGVVTEHHKAEGGRLTASRVDAWKDLIGDEDELRRLEALLGCGSLDPASLPDATEGARQLPDGVRTHEQELVKGWNQRKYLTNAQVSFVSPGKTHRAEPDNLLRHLTTLSAPGSRPGDLGVVLVGAAGSGKTRTCFEVAERAAEKGWTVLHVERDATVSAEELADIVGAFHSAGRDVLLVLDYLDRYTALGADFADKVEERRTARARLTCIASLRPGAVQDAEDRGQMRLFEQIEVCQEDSHQEAVTRGIVANAAQKAVEAFGTDEVAQVCGTRPVLALLIAKAIEYRYLHGERDVLQRTGLRNDKDLSYWLSQRTREDLGDGRTGPGRTRLLASAVAAAACPQGRDAVEDAVAAFLDAHGDRDFEDGEIGVVGHLIDLSWLLESAGGLDVMHDFVADELLQQALLPNRTRLESTTAARMLTAFLVSAGTFARAATHLRRWSTDLDAGKREEVRRVCDKWLRREGAAGLAARLASTADPAESERTLRALLSGPPWQSGVIEAWDRLVEPWLARAAEEAPHLTQWFLVGAVRDTSEAVPERLSATAVAWVEANPGLRRETRSVLEALLRAPGVCRTHRSTAARLAVKWLGEHGTSWGSRPLVLAEALLAREDLPADVVEQAVAKGLSVAVSHLPVPATAHVLDRLLGRAGLESRLRDEVLRLAFTWLGRHPDAESASFVLVPLLKSEDLGRPRVQSVFDRSLNWLAGQGTSPLAAFVLRHLLMHPDLYGKRSETAAVAAVEWLAKRGTSHEATFVLSPLLLRSDHGLDPEHLTNLALAWLKSHHPCGDAHFVLCALLARTQLPDGVPERTAQYAMAWLRTGTHGVQEMARSVLGDLLKRTEVPGAHDHCDAAVSWLDVETNLASEEASFVLRPLLKHPALGPHTQDAVRLALGWLERHPESENVSFVLGPLLALHGVTWNRDAPGTDDPVAIAFNWLTAHGTSPEARFLLGPLLRPDRAGVRAARPALTWLRTDSHGTLDVASHMLQPLLTCPGLDEDLIAEAVDRALDWLEVHHTADTAHRVLTPLFDIDPPDPTRRSRMVGRLLECVDDGHVDMSHEQLRALCRKGPLPVGQGSRIAEHVAERSRPPATLSKSAVERLGVTLRRQEIGKRQLAPLVDLADKWLGNERCMRSRGTKLLMPLLSRTDLDHSQARRVVVRALEWLDVDRDTSFAGVILGLLLSRPEAPVYPDRATGEPSKPVRKALAWLEAYPSHAYTAGVLSVLLERPGLLTRTQEDDCSQLAADWLRTAEHPEAPDARQLAEVLARRPDQNR
ncbi:serine protease [Streptomyces sp. WMMB 322]|uniref:S1 family peptidase n=1 Tax=Streptomyces sp. WMMB 322 TaxID=1286821 RepID=UPI0006E1564C|nr:serine protease [Streptomyces sp. WMMB 322]SCK20761.1 Trypsin-like peptidase domain-containing protein [Streptomyces sp. WMMB 322]